MTEKKLMIAEDVLGSALSVPLNLVLGIADLLIAKGVLSRQDMAALAQGLSGQAPAHGENEAMVRMILEPIAARYEDAPSGRN